MSRNTAKKGAGPQIAVVLGRNGVYPRYPKNASESFDKRLPRIVKRARRNAASFVDKSIDMLFNGVDIPNNR